MVPLVGSSSRFNNRSSDDFPDPLGPTMARVSPLRTSKVAPLTRIFPGTLRPRFSTRNMTESAWPGSGRVMLSWILLETQLHHVRGDCKIADRLRSLSTVGESGTYRRGRASEHHKGQSGFRAWGGRRL